MTWQPIKTAPKKIVDRDGPHEFGPYILAYPVFGEVARVRWWQSADGEERYRNWLEDGGNAVHPTHWQPLPRPPRERR